MDKAYLWEALDTLLKDKPVHFIIQGGARGADALADDWATQHGIHSVTVHALWKRYGPGAGPKRNEAMLMLEPDLVIAFPGGRGTDNMIQLAKEAMIQVIRIPIKS